MTEASWSDAALGLVKKVNNFNCNPASSKPACKRFYIDGVCLGFIRPDVWQELQRYEHIFTHRDGGIHVCDDLSDHKSRTLAFQLMLEELRSKCPRLITLKGWRDESYDVKEQFSDQPLMKIERSAAGLFGVTQYSVVINGYSFQDGKDLCLWIAQRSHTKETWPGMMDTMAAGGLPSGLGVTECAMKEAQEEANVGTDLMDNLKPVGALSFTYEIDRGIYPEVQFCFDLHLPAHFTPSCNDGEVDSFQLLTVDEVKSLLVSGTFKPNSAVATLDFFIRHGILTPDQEVNYIPMVSLMHSPLA